MYTNFVVDEKFFDVFESLPCLWDTTCSNHRDQNARREAYKTMTEQLNLKYNETVVNIVKEKIRNLRSSYAGELRRRRAAEECGLGEIQHSTWKWFNRLQFLAPHVNIRRNPYIIVCDNGSVELANIKKETTEKTQIGKRNQISLLNMNINNKKTKEEEINDHGLEEIDESDFANNSPSPSAEQDSTGFSENEDPPIRLYWPPSSSSSSSETVTTTATPETTVSNSSNSTRINKHILVKVGRPRTSTTANLNDTPSSSTTVAKSNSLSSPTNATQMIDVNMEKKPELKRKREDSDSPHYFFCKDLQCRLDAFPDPKARRLKSQINRIVEEAEFEMDNE